jgi:hypothetical protein
MHAPEKPIPLARLSPVWPPPRDRYPWEIGRAKVWLGGLGIVALLWFGMPAFFKWPHVLSASGGRYFIHRTVIPVSPFQQNDPLWSEQLLGNTIDTIGQEGCAITSAAMILHAYGVDTDPPRLNAYLNTHGGYVGDGLLVWERAGDIAGGQVQKAYEDLPSYALIDANILKGNPVIIRLHLRNGTTHFVVVVGKQGWDYLIRDPARAPGYGVYPLKNLVSRIQALRFYTILPPPKPIQIHPENPLVPVPPLAPLAVPLATAGAPSPVALPIAPPPTPANRAAAASSAAVPVKPVGAP